MNWIHFFSLTSPWIVVLITTFVVLFVGIFFKKQHFLLPLVSFAGVAIAFLLSWQLWLSDAHENLGMFFLNRMTFLGWMVVLLATGFTLLLSPQHLKERALGFPEYYGLLLLSVIGMGVFIAASDLLTLFLGLELMSIAVYPLAGFYRTRLEGNEAALKYFLTGAFASAFLLMGIAFLFGSSGTTDLHLFSQKIPEIVTGEMQHFFFFGVALLVIGFAFKIAAVPFHAWAPDTYEGAITPITHFMATAVKAAAFFAFLRFALIFFPVVSESGKTVLAILAVATMVVGNLGAIAQESVKRMLAYSSIAHAGYMLVAFPLVGMSSDNAASVAFYLLAYVLMTAGAFAVLIVVQKDRESTDVAIFAGFGKERPLLAALFTIFLISLTGLPPTNGFFAKYYLFYGAVKGGYLWLVIVGLLNSVISAYYYLRPVVVMYFYPPKGEEEHQPIAPGIVAVVTVTALAVILFGIFPAELLALVEQSMR